MQSYRKLLGAALLASASSRAMGQTTYNIQRIGLTGSLYQGVANGKPLEQNTLQYADSSGVLIGAASEFNGQTSSINSAEWYFNGSTTAQIGLTGVPYTRPNAGSNAVFAGTTSSSVLSGSFQATRIYNNGYVGGVTSRYDAGANSEGPDAWISNGTGTNQTGGTTKIGLPTLASGGSNTTYGSNLSYSYVNPNTAAATFGDTIQSMGGGAGLVLPAGNGSAAGAALVYYANTATSPTTYTAIGNGFSDYDAWYYNGTSTVQIGLIGGGDVNTTGATANQPFDRSSQPIAVSSSGVVFGYSKYYGGSTALTTANGQDLWIYDPNNATGTGANGTMLVAPTTTVSGESYQGGNSALTSPLWTNNNGQFAAAYQLFASSDTPRATSLGQDAFVGTYSAGSVNFTPVGLTGSAYTFYSSTGTTAKAGFGGSNIGTTGSLITGSLYQYPALNAVGDAIGYTKRTAASGTATIGQDAWVYYPTGHVPTGGTAGTTQVGLTGGAYATTNTSGGVFESSAAFALSAGGAVAGVSQRYTTAGSTATAAITTAGQDAFYYDPAHGITSSVQVGLSSPNAVLTTGSGMTPSSYAYTPSGATNNYSSSTITAMNNSGLVGGTTVRNPATGGASSGADAWVYSATNHLTYLVDPTAANASISSPNYVYSTVSFITDTGLAFGYDYSIATPGSGPAYYDKLFEWYLNPDGTQSFEYLGTAVNAASFTAGNWAQLDTAATIANYPDITASGNIVGLGTLSTEDSTSYVPFLLTPAAVPEPASLSLIGLGGLALLGRRRRRTA